MAEFTGERVIPGQVDPDLWNEHIARYLFASRLGRRKKVLDLGCGAGYGSAEMAATAAYVVGVDVSVEAIALARREYARSNVTYVCGSGEALPFHPGTFDLVVAFEMIEHLADWEALLREARRVLAPAGQFVVSTPNRLFYAESRRLSGPNPYHRHEFDYAEFDGALRSFFPHVSMFVQNHGPSIVLQPVGGRTGAEVRIEGGETPPEASNFFVAVCAATPQTGAPAFVHVPSSGNVLRERNEHIVKLEEELVTKDQWLDEAKAEHRALMEKFRQLENELLGRTRWAEQLDAELEEARGRIDRLYAEKDAEIAAMAAGYEEKIATLEHECESQSRWAMQTQQKLDAKSQELAKCVELLKKAETTVVERTEWARRLDGELAEVKGKLSMVEASRWVRLGGAIGIGPGPRLK